MAIRRASRHACPDCGTKHRSPGETKHLQDSWLNCLHCGERFSGDYVVKDAVWSGAGLKPYDGTCHLKCLEERLGRNLVAGDLKQIPANEAIFHMLKRGAL